MVCFPGWQLKPTVLGPLSSMSCNSHALSYIHPVIAKEHWIAVSFASGEGGSVHLLSQVEKNNRSCVGQLVCVCVNELCVCVNELCMCVNECVAGCRCVPVSIMCVCFE